MCPTGEFKECTILFSDVVTFTNICAMCEPIQIVHMLNSMYLQFDRLTTVHNVYKVNMNGVTWFFPCTFHWKRKEPFMHFHKAFGYRLGFFPIMSSVWTWQSIFLFLPGWNHRGCLYGGRWGSYTCLQPCWEGGQLCSGHDYSCQGGY